MAGFATTNKHPQARYFVFEGPDGTGKSTQAHFLYDFFAAHLSPERVLLTSQPWYEGHRGDMIRQYLRKQISLSPGEVFDLYVDNRVHHLCDVVVPALEAGKVVIQDRSYYSTVAYQGTQGLPIDEIVKAHKNMEIPNAVFILQTPLDVSLGRLRTRLQQTRHAAEIFEDRTTQEQVAGHFSQMHYYFPHESIFYITASGCVEEVHSIIKQFVQHDLESILKYK